MLKYSEKNFKYGILKPMTTGSDVCQSIKQEIAQKDDPFRRRVIFSIGLVVGAIVLLGLIPRYLISPMPLIPLLRQILLGLFTLFVPVLVRLNVKTQHCASALIVILTLIGINAAFYNGGMMAPATVILIITPVIGFFCSGARCGRIALLLSTITLAIILWAEKNSLVYPVADMNKYTLYKSYVYFLACLVAYALGAAYERSRAISEAYITELSIKSTQAAKMSSLGEMAAGIAHEVNNPLAIIDGKTSLLIKQIESGKIDPQKISEELHKIKNTTARIGKIVKGLKTFSRNVETDPMEPTLLKSLIDDSLELCQERLKKHSVQVEVICEPGLTLDCRPSQISQIILNLIGNSCDAIEIAPEKWITIEVTADSENVKLMVTDSGHGIPSDVIDKMMQPFFTTKPMGKGTGLGLSISIGLAQQHHGKLQYDPNSKNTRFVLELPLHQPEMAQT